MKRLLTKLALLAAPYALYLALPFWVLLGTGELRFNVDEIVARAVHGTPQLFGFRFNESAYKCLKLRTLSTLPRRDVVALGSSRVLQFRDKMFAPATFYNAGYTITSVPHFLAFVSALPEDRLPKTLIVGLDQWMFNKKADSLDRASAKVNFTGYEQMDFVSVCNASDKIYKKVFDGSLRLGEVGTTGAAVCGKGVGAAPLTTVGFNACVNKTGFLNDGSMHYGGQIDRLLAGAKSADDYQFRNTLKKIEKGDTKFSHGDRVNPEAVRQLRPFLDFCRKRNIQVVAFLPPFSDTAYRAMIGSGKFQYLDQLAPALAPVFREYGYEFYDFSSVSRAGSTDQEAVDGFHGSESVYLNMLIRMLEAGSALNGVCDVNALRESAAHKKNRYLVYDMY
ncbi:hypothetical protein M1B72_03940 [Geomonas paludis]|uniref:Uncharacterized protein n=1 Tax=Geomonas paludis TaxID=2740185 RepID=A0A6V8N2F2_9BACT|nr:hypothetical protein [Geomonas paludis]UPU36869.1 hypothetical protein M1B72_03940 [Geomonas paludis]GFO65539.1 hypothetical protein GMPD_34580 [Geomonas paludis]